MIYLKNIYYLMSTNKNKKSVSAKIIIFNMRKVVEEKKRKINKKKRKRKIGEKFEV